MSDKVIQATEQSFENEIKTEQPVIVDFWAEWCGPCRALTPVIEELAGEYEGRVKIMKVNVDENQAVAARFQIMSIPTLVFLKGGNEVEKLIGAHPKNTIKSKIDGLLA